MKPQVLSASNTQQAAAFLAQRILEAVQNSSSAPFVFGLDGRAASGKTTLAAALVQELSNRLKELETPLKIQLIHLDDYFLSPAQRDPKRLEQPGMNVDSERIVRQILEPAKAGRPMIFQPYSCSRSCLEKPSRLEVPDLLILEGAYVHNPDLKDCLDASCFVSCSFDRQKKRILVRNGAEKLRDFEERWIPLEEFYIDELHPDHSCDWLLDSESWF